MKIISIVILILAVNYFECLQRKTSYQIKVQNEKKSLHHHQHHHHIRFKTIQQIHKSHNNELKVSANGMHLRNHFGYKPSESPYGGKQDQIDIKKLVFKNKDGSWSRAINPNMDHDALVGDSCDIKQSSYYEYCTGITTCEECNANTNICSWCPGNNKCNPGVKEGCHCPNICPFTIDPNIGCKQSLRLFGEIKNVSPFSVGMIKPEIATPKFRKHIKTLEIVPGQAQIQVGTAPQRVKMAFHKTGHNKQFNQLSTEWTTQQVPVYQSIPISKILETDEYKYFDPQTNKELHEAKHHEQKVLHGIDV